MAEVQISYKGSAIAQMNASGTKTLLTEGKYLEDDVTVEYTRPSTPSPTLITKNITENGTYDAEDDNADGYSEVTVNVSGGGGTPYYEPWNNSSFFERIGIQSNSGVEQIGTTGVYYATSTTRVSTRPVIDASEYGDEWYFIPLGAGVRFFARLFDENLTEQLFSGGWVDSPTKYDFSTYNYKYIVWSISYSSGAGVSLSDYDKVMVLTRQVPSGSSATEYTAEEVVDTLISGSRPSGAALSMLNSLLYGNKEETE